MKLFVVQVPDFQIQTKNAHTQTKNTQISLLNMD